MASSQSRLPNETTLKQKTIQGTLWTLLSYGLGNGLRFGSNLVLTRLLEPKLFGLMTLVNTIILGLRFFSDVGFGPNVIQNKRGDDPVYLNTAWTLEILRGGLIWLITIAIAGPVSQFYGQSALAWLLPLLGCIVLVDSTRSTSVYRLSRRLELRTLEMFSLAEQIISVTTMLVWAWCSRSIWALVVGMIASTLVRITWTHWLNRHTPNRLAWDWSAVRDIFSFGKWILLSTSATFLALQADRLILGKLIPITLLGVYGIAMTFADIPRLLVGSVGGKVLLPAIAQVSDRPRAELRQTLMRYRKPLLLFATLPLALLTSYGDIVISTLYDSRYVEASWMLPILVLGIWPNMLHESIRQALVAVGKPNYEAYGQVLKCLMVCLGVPIGFHLAGLGGAVLVVALNDLPLYGAISVGLWREDLTVVKQDIVATGLLVLLVSLGVGSRWFLGFGWPLQHLWS